MIIKIAFLALMRPDKRLQGAELAFVEPHVRQAWRTGLDEVVLQLRPTTFRNKAFV
jgi:hypothetical protein